MEITTKGIAALVIPTLVTLSAGFIDNALKWRAELQQREYERQIRILDKIVNMTDPDQRIVVATFYLNSGTFTGLYKDELEASLIWAKAEIQKRSATPVPTPTTSITPPAVIPPFTASVQSEAAITAGAEGIADFFTHEITIPVEAEPVKLEPPKNIFTFDVK